MASFAVALPVKDREAGMQAVERFLQEDTDVFHDQRRRHGFTRTQVWLQSKPQEMVIFYIEADDVTEALAKRHGDQHDFESYVDEVIEKATGHSLRTLHEDGDPSVLLFDWRQDKGVSKTGH